MKEELEKAREVFRLGKIEFSKLDDVFFKYASEEEIRRFWSAPVYDRAGVIKGKTQAELDADWNNLIS